MTRATCWLVLGVLACPPAVAGEMLRNAAFKGDADKDGVADAWIRNVHEGATGTFALERDEAGHGVQRIDHTREGSEWVRVSQTDLKARPKSLYVASVDVKATGPWHAILYQFKARAKDADDYISNWVGSGTACGWKRVSKAIETTEDATEFKLSLVTHGKGTAWFRNPSLVLLGERLRLLVPRCGAGPELDGKLGDAAWRDAAAVSDFYRLDGQGARAEVKTTVRVCASQETLYVAFECAEPAMGRRVLGDVDGKPATWNDDMVELFLQPEDTGTYWHLGVTSGGGVVVERRATGTHSTWATWIERLGSDEPELGAKAVVQARKGGWTAEVSIPLAALGGVRRPGAVWRANLTRSRKVTGRQDNSTWVYIDGETFHQPKFFGEWIFGGASATKPEVIAASEVMRKHPSEPPTIVPRPKRQEWGGSRPIPVDASCSVVGPKGPAGMLTDMVARRTGLRLRVAERPGDGPAIRMVTKPQEHPEQYTLRADAKGATLEAADERGLFNAAATMAQLITWHDGRVLLWPADVEDWPDLRWRAWHLIGPTSPEALDASKRVIGVMAGLKYNVVCLQIDNRLRYERRPALSGSNPPTKAQLRELVSYAESCGMEVIPMTQCWSHFGYFLNKKEFAHLNANPDPKKKGRHTRWNYCPRHPEVHPILFDMIEEQLECFPTAKYYHVGLDEISFGAISEHPLTKGTPPHVVFAEEVKRLHDFVTVKKKLRMCMWGDQLLVSHNGGAPHHTSKALDEVPRDIIIFDWHYPAARSFPSVAFFKEHGFDVVASGWYEPINVTYLSKAAVDQGVLGYGGTTWWGLDRIHLEPRLRGAIPLAGEMAWSWGKPALEEIAYRPAEVFGRLWPASEPRVVSEFVIVDLSAHCNEYLDDREGRRWLTDDRSHSLACVPKGRQVWCGMPFQVGPRSGEGYDCVVLADDAKESRYPEGAHLIPVGAKLDALAFVHTVSQPRTFAEHIYDRRHANPTHLGRYEVRYQDGERAKIELRWRENVSHWNNRFGAALAETARVGKTRGGALVRVEVYRWPNPRPKAAIESVSLISGKDHARPVLLAITGVRYR